MLSIFGERERPNYSAIRLDSLCSTELVWTGHIYRRVDCYAAREKQDGI